MDMLTLDQQMETILTTLNQQIIPDVVIVTDRNGISFLASTPQITPEKILIVYRAVEKSICDEYKSGY